MTTFSYLIRAVQKIISDDSRLSLITGEDIKEKLNQAVFEIAGGLYSTLGSWITPPLPELFTIATVTTSTEAAYVDMPDNFHRDLQFVSSSKGIEIDIAHNFISFAEIYPLLNKTGSIIECIEFGKKFYYQGIPVEEETVTIHYYRVPVDMILDDDIPDGIPAHLQEGLLVNYVCWKIFDLVRDFSSENIDYLSSSFKDRFYANLSLLELTIPYVNRRMLIM